MRAVLILWSLLLMAAAASSLPNACQGGSCRTRPVGRRNVASSPAARSSNSPPAFSPADSKLEPSRPLVSSAGLRSRPQAAARRPGSSRPSTPSGRPAPPAANGFHGTPAPSRSRPARPSRRRTTTTSRVSVTTEATEAAVTEAVTEEVREVGVNGWLAAPTLAPIAPLARTEAPPKPDKPGLCEAPKMFGVKCMSRMDQCRYDQECPGPTKCCMVGECGYLCVKPKPTSNTAKQSSKETVKKNKNGLKESAEGREGGVEIEERTTEEGTELEGKEGRNNQQKTDDGGEGGLSSTTTLTGAATTTTTTTATSTTTSSSTSDVEKEAEATLESPTLP